MAKVANPVVSSTQAEDTSVVWQAPEPQKQVELSTVVAAHSPMEDPSTLRVIGVKPEPIGTYTNWMKVQVQAGKLKVA